MGTSSWSPTSWNSSLLRLLRPLEFAPTNTLPRTLVKKPSISVCESIPSTSSESTRCCHVPERIDCRLVCVVPTVSPNVSSPVSESVSPLCLCELRSNTPLTLSRLFDVLNSSSLVAKRSSPPRNGDSPSSTKRSLLKVSKQGVLSPMESDASTAPITDHSPPGRNRCRLKLLPKGCFLSIKV